VLNNIFPYLLLSTLGLIVGSFLNVCIYRIPRGGSIVSPPSRCPSCGSPISPLENIPIISYIALRGRCRSCGSKISLRYPLVEALNAVLWVIFYMRFGYGWHLFFYLAFASSLIVITFIDIDFQIIPDRITLLGIPIGLLAGSYILPDPFLRASLLGFRASILGAVFGFILFYAVAVVSRGGMGGGDIKLMALIGALTGWKGVLLTTFAGSMVGSVVGIALMLFKGKGRKTKIPFGPFLSLGSLITLLFGQEIIHWYLYAGH